MEKKKVTKVKEPKTFIQQIEILKDRKLGIENEDRTEKLLSNINYYRLIGYGLHLKDEHGYKEGVTLEIIFKVYEFDKKLKHILMGILGTIEISFRTKVAYFLAHQYGALGYLNNENFKNASYHEGFIKELNRERKYNKDKQFIKHHINTYDGKLPVWVAIEIMSFGMVSRLYSNLITQDKTEIRNSYVNNINNKVLTSWLVSLTELRNVCAHYGRVYNSNFLSTPEIHKNDLKYNLNLDRIFVRIIAIKYMIQYEEEWISFIDDLKRLLNDYKEYIELDLIGFPENWIEILSRN